jgi:hypothetical protein
MHKPASSNTIIEFLDIIYRLFLFKIQRFGD